jgi:undecaprenyl-diphosphatase
MLTAVVLEKTMSLTLKNTVRRKRPCREIADIVCSSKPQDKYSFPSGHSGVSGLTIVLFAVFFPPLAPLAGAFLILNGYSRIYHGVHYPGDVLVGVILGILSAIISLILWL